MSYVNRCEGVKPDGSACQNWPMIDGYCHRHQGQKPNGRTVAANMGPGWVQGKGGRWHLLTAWPSPFAKRYFVWHGSIKRRQVTMFKAWTVCPVDACFDCDRARQIDRVRSLAARLAS